MKALLAAGTGSLGGARPKASVLGDDGRQLIAKFPHQTDEWDVMAWEATALDLASAAGVTVPPHRLSRVDGRHLVLLDRFDRSSTGRVGYVSAMTVLEERDGASADYEDIAERIPEISEQPSRDLRELFRRVAVSVGMNNTDDHLRNHGFLRRRSGWVLSPAFDLNPNPDPALRQTSLAGAASPIDEADGLVSLAASCRLSAEQAREELRAVVAALEGWREVALANEIPASQTKRFERSFSDGLDTVRRASR